MKEKEVAPRRDVRQWDAGPKLDVAHSDDSERNKGGEGGESDQDSEGGEDSEDLAVQPKKREECTGSSER